MYGVGLSGAAWGAMFEECAAREAGLEGNLAWCQTWVTAALCARRFEGLRSWFTLLAALSHDTPDRIGPGFMATKSKAPGF